MSEQKKNIFKAKATRNLLNLLNGYKSNMLINNKQLFKTYSLRYIMYQFGVGSIYSILKIVYT